MRNKTIFQSVQSLLKSDQGYGYLIHFSVFLFTYYEVGFKMMLNFYYILNEMLFLNMDLSM